MLLATHGSCALRLCLVPSTGIIKNDLFNINSRRRRRGRPASAQDDPDGFTRNFGSAVPQNIPESRRLFIRLPRSSLSWRGFLWMFTFDWLSKIVASAWWRTQAKDLFALTEEGEMGIPREGVSARPWG